MKIKIDYFHQEKEYTYKLTVFDNISPVISYTKIIQTTEGTEIDLLKKKQIFGKHAELFTYCLFNQMKSKTLKISLDYEYTKLEDDQPFMKCSFISTQNPSSKIESKIFYEDKSKYTILIYVQNKPIVERTLSQKGFSIQGDYYEKKCVSDAIIEQELIGLQNTLEPIL